MNNLTNNLAGAPLIQKGSSLFKHNAWKFAFHTIGITGIVAIYFIDPNGEENLTSSSAIVALTAIAMYGKEAGTKLAQQFIGTGSKT